ncbi:MAG TPA: hypothetical protein PLQ80_08540 [Candidatus Syntrophosphaera sp.]|nr:hypothetical protein [Candidatus Syntrophosphaera sp.]
MKVITKLRLCNRIFKQDPGQTYLVSRVDTEDASLDHPVEVVPDAPRIRWFDAQLDFLIKLLIIAVAYPNTPDLAVGVILAQSYQDIFGFKAQSPQSYQSPGSLIQIKLVEFIDFLSCLTLSGFILRVSLKIILQCEQRIGRPQFSDLLVHQLFVLCQFPLGRLYLGEGFLNGLGG